MLVSISKAFIASVLQNGDMIEQVSPVWGHTVVNAYRNSLIACFLTIALPGRCTQHLRTWFILPNAASSSKKTIKGLLSFSFNLEVAKISGSFFKIFLGCFVFLWVLWSWHFLFPIMPFK